MAEPKRIEAGPLVLYIEEPWEPRLRPGGKWYADVRISGPGFDCYLTNPSLEGDTEDAACAAANDALETLRRQIIAGLLAETEREVIDGVIDHLETYLDETSAVLGRAASVLEEWILTLRRLAAKGVTT